MELAAEIGVIGGSGFYDWLAGGTSASIETPYGDPSGPLTVGTIAGRSVAFLPRHGVGHAIPPDKINARANLWAFRELGVARVIGPCAVGSLRIDIGPGDVVVLDQLVDRTWGREDTYSGAGTVEHVSFADPYCPELRTVLGDAALSGWTAGAVHTAGTLVVIQGPRFSTRAESHWYSSAGLDVIGMTQYPEAYLARELGMCYSGLALVTDRDVGVEGDPGAPAVTMETVLEVLRANVDHTRALLATAIPAIPPERSCGCARSGLQEFRR